jgi:carbon-monoxide dehydrogenase small subunit
MSEAEDDDRLMTLTINGVTVRRRAKTRQHLADFLREALGLTGTHLGCEHGVCGACTVLVDGLVTRGCLFLVVQAEGKTIQTIEGLTADGTLGVLREAFMERNAAQCGFCSAGMLLTANELLVAIPHPSREAIRSFLSGNFCRCTGYQAIVDAVALAADRLAAVRVVT